MKKTIILLLSISILLFGCSDLKSSTDDSNSSDLEKNIKYTIEQIYFSKAFQSITPNVEAIEVNSKKKLNVNLGLSQYSEISIDDMKLEGNEFNIYISGYGEKSTSSLSVPQMILELEDKSLESIKNIDFNIIYNDYDNIDIKFKINDVLNKLESQFKLALNSSPSFNLTRQGEKIVWEITYINIISGEDEDYPLINLTAEVDANTGEVLGYKKEKVSSIIDTGTILSFNNEGGLLYEKTIDPDKGEKLCELWFYDSNTEGKNIICSCHSSIQTAAISDDLSNIAFIEKTDNSSEAYIYSNMDSKIYKLQFDRSFNPQIIRWKTNNLLYLLENTQTESIIYSYDINTNELILISSTNKNILNIIAGETGFIVAEKIDEQDNKKLSFTEDFKKYKTIDNGFNPSFINKINIAYLKNDEKTDQNYLIIFDLEEEKIIGKVSEDVLNYRTSPPDNIVYIKSNPKYKDFTLSKYSLDLKTSNNILKIINENVYYNDKQNLIYINIESPFENENSKIIYSIDLDEKSMNLNREIKTP